MIEDIKKILIIKLRAIGDVVLATPVIQNLRQAFPGAKIDFLTERAAVPVVEGNPYLDGVIPLDRDGVQSMDRWATLWRNVTFINKIRRQQYDLVLDLFGNPRSALLTLLSGARYRVGYNFRGRKYAYNLVVEPRGDRVHEVEFNLDALRKIGVEINGWQPHFPLDQESLDFVDRFFAQNSFKNNLVVGINSSGGWPAKKWKLTHFAALADRLVEQLGAAVILIWGPGEREEVKQLSALMQQPHHLAPETNLKQLGALLKRCHLVISNDSGPMHISAAVGTPTVGIFGPTNSGLQGPYGTAHEVAKKTTLNCLGCNKLICKTNECMEDLSVEEVWEIVEKCLVKNKLLPRYLT